MFFINYCLFTVIFGKIDSGYEEFKKEYKELNSEGITEQEYKEFAEKYKCGAKLAGKISKGLSNIFYVYLVLTLLLFLILCNESIFKFFSTFLGDCMYHNIFKNILIASSILSVVVAYLVYKVDKNLPGLENIMAKEFDLPIIYSTIFILVFSIVLTFYHSISEYTNAFSTGAIAFQIIIANLTFDVNLYEKKYMYHNYKSKK